MAYIILKKKLRKKNPKKIQIDVLDYIKEICGKNGLRYYLAYGTLFLGAVRHRGFIPWDDDIDILYANKRHLSSIQYITK